MRYCIEKLLFCLSLAILIFAVGLIGCSKSGTSNFSNLATNQPVTNKLPTEISNIKVDTHLQGIALNFQKKLEYYSGDLNSLTLDNGIINAEWSSKKCDWFREEIIDLAISINRGYTDSVKGISVTRTCNSNTRKFSVSGDKFDKYKSGQISDTQFTEGIK